MKGMNMDEHELRYGDPQAVAIARVQAEGRIAGRRLRALLLDSWAVPVLEQCMRFDRWLKRPDAARDLRVGDGEHFCSVMFRSTPTRYWVVHYAWGGRVGVRSTKWGAMRLARRHLRATALQ